MGKLKLFCCNTQCRISVLVAPCSSLSSHDCTPLLGCSGCSHYHETSLPSATQTSYNSWRGYLFFWPFLLNQISALTTNPLGNAKLFILFNRLVVFSLAWRHLTSFLLLVGLLYPACCMVFPEFRCEYPTTFAMLVTLENIFQSTLSRWAAKSFCLGQDQFQLYHIMTLIKMAPMMK